MERTFDASVPRASEETRSGNPRANAETATGAAVELPDVLLHDFRGSDMRLAGVVAGLEQRAALPQQVPALVEFDLELHEAFVVIFGARRVLHERMFLSDEALNVREHLVLGLLFVHGIAPSRFVLQL
jgi:hypothetical protein